MKAYAHSKTKNEDKDRRATPSWLISALLLELRINAFDFDICAEKTTAKAVNYFTVADNSLSFDWSRRIRLGSFVFMNPPYSDPTPWVKRANKFSVIGEFFVVGVLPDDRAASWYKEHIENQATHCWLPQERVSFLDAKGKPQGGNPKATVCPLWTPWRTGTTTYSRLKHSPKTLRRRT